MRGVLVTVSVFLLTKTKTRSHLKLVVTDDPSSIIMALTKLFCFSIIFCAISPGALTSSGHELFPVCHTSKIKGKRKINNKENSFFFFSLKRRRINSRQPFIPLHVFAILDFCAVGTWELMLISKWVLVLKELRGSGFLY